MEEDKQFLSEFIDIYKSLPSLWKVKSKEYSNRVIKNADYEKLIEKLKEKYPNATKETAVKKINNLRCAYRRELKKIVARQRSGADPDDIYQPTLWYFNLLVFLQDQEQSDTGRNSMEEEDVNKPNISELRPKRKKIVSEDDKLIRLACEKLEGGNKYPSENDNLSQSWADQYSEMDATQKVIARKIISDVLFQGCVGSLTIQHATQIQNIFSTPVQHALPEIDVIQSTHPNHFEFRCRACYE